MIRVILASLLFLFSLLAIVPVPAKQLWYAAIAVGEFPWVWMIGTALLLLWCAKAQRYRKLSLVISLIALVIFSTPIIRAYGVASDLDARIDKAFHIKTADLRTPHRNSPFSLAQFVTGIPDAKKKVAYRTMEYAVNAGVPLTLDFYPAQAPGPRPCLIVVHGGSWKSGDSHELPDVDNYFAKAGYQVAAINYRLAPQYKSPAPQEDLHSAFAFLRAHAAEMNIDTSNFVITGRSAGGQIVLTAAYSLHERGLKGVMGFYGPADMIFGYENPHNQLVIRHRAVMEDFFGGTPAQVRQQYIDGSATQFVTPQSVPTLLVHGMLDQHVHFDESKRMHHVLDSAGVPNLLLGLPWATHGCEYTLNGPSGQLAVYCMERFMAAVTR